MATTTTMTPRLARIPERVLIEEMDRARHMAEDANRVHDTIAYELGYERVRINCVTAGDQLRYFERGQASFRTVEKIDHRVDDVASWYRCSLVAPDNDNDVAVRSFDDGEFVSRRLPTIDEPF